jgi:hypothetical protein
LPVKYFPSDFLMTGAFGITHIIVISRAVGRRLQRRPSCATLACTAITSIRCVSLPVFNCSQLVYRAVHCVHARLNFSGPHHYETHYYTVFFMADRKSISSDRLLSHNLSLQVGEFAHGCVPHVCTDRPFRLRRFLQGLRRARGKYASPS